MSHSSASNGGFRPQEVSRRRFQQAAAITLDNQAKAITATREFMADLSESLDKAKVDLAAFQNRSFLSRLRWLFTGK